MDENILSGILVRIERIKSELDELEKEAKSLSAGLASQEKADETAMSVSEEPIDLSISVPDISEQMHEAVSEAEPSEDIPVADEEPVEVETAEEKTAEVKTTEGEIAEESEIEDMPEMLEDGPEAEADPTAIEATTLDAVAIEDIPEQSEAKTSEPEKSEQEASEPEKAEAKPEQKAPVAEKKTRKRKSVMDTELAEKAVLDVMAEKEAWRTDRPGYPVKNIISAISLNDRLLLINSLFREDPVLFQDTIAKFNGMASLQEAIDYIKENFKDWDLNSEPVYRLMMAARRKLQ